MYVHFGFECGAYRACAQDSDRRVAFIGNGLIASYPGFHYAPQLGDVL